MLSIPRPAASTAIGPAPPRWDGMGWAGMPSGWGTLRSAPGCARDRRRSPAHKPIRAGRQLSAQRSPPLPQGIRPRRQGSHDGMGLIAGSGRPLRGCISRGRARAASGRFRARGTASLELRGWAASHMLVLSTFSNAQAARWRGPGPQAERKLALPGTEPTQRNQLQGSIIEGRPAAQGPQSRSGVDGIRRRSPPTLHHLHQAREAERQRVPCHPVKPVP